LFLKSCISLNEKQEELQAHRTQLIKENREAQKKVNYFDKLLDDFVQVKAFKVKEKKDWCCSLFYI
jgi:hypothetical protein